MAAPPKYQKAKRRGKSGFAPVMRHLAPTQKKIGGKRGFHDQTILLHWREMVGEDIARISQPHTVKRRRDGRMILVVNCVSAYAAEMRMRTDEITMRINARLGMSAIERIDIRHQHVGFAEVRAPFAPAPKITKPKCDMPDTLRQDITKTQNEGLRDALSALSSSFYERRGR